MVLVYSRESCAPCKTLKYWLSKRGIEFEEAAPDSSVTIYPTVQIGEVRIVGLNPARVLEVLAAQTTVS